MTGNEGSADFQAVRDAIQALELGRAQALLERISDHSAEWFFLMGAVYYRRGWMDEALTHYEAAARLEPKNPEYRQAAERMREGPKRSDKKLFGTLSADSICLGLAGTWCFCKLGSCCAGCVLCIKCYDCIQQIPH